MSACDDEDGCGQSGCCGDGCHYAPYPDEPDEESYHYLRTCDVCGNEWFTLHCIHDGIQNPCPQCGWRSPSSRTPMEALGFVARPGDV